MVIQADGEKYACDACVRGHRVSSCTHKGTSSLRAPSPLGLTNSPSQIATSTISTVRAAPYLSARTAAACARTVRRTSNASASKLVWPDPKAVAATAVCILSTFFWMVPRLTFQTLVPPAIAPRASHAFAPPREKLMRPTTCPRLPL